MPRLAPQTVLKTVVAERLIVRCDHDPPFSSIGCSSNGKTVASKSTNEGSIPSQSAKFS